MRILLISSAFSGLAQRYYTELDDAGYTVSVELHLGDEARLLEGVELFSPDLILCPFLTRRIPKVLYQHLTCLIVHPGIVGDRGPSSLDWAIQEGWQEWGVTLMQADDQMDAGPIWASKTFPLRATSKSSLFNREVTQAAIDCLWDVLTYVEASNFQPQPLDYSRPEVKGRLRPQIKQADRAIDWEKHRSDEILRRIHAADGSPGVLDELFGQPFYLYDAYPATGFTGKAGDIVAVAEQAICRATVDGAIWIGHLKAKRQDGRGIKLPATQALKDYWPQPAAGLKRLLNKPAKTLAIDHLAPGRQWPGQQVWYELDRKAAYLHFPFHNGGMSTEQCQLLLRVYRHLASLDIDAIVLMGGDDCWSNGIHLNHIEAAADPAGESWRNINAIDDLIHQIVTTLDKLTIAAIAGNAGAGGAILAIAPDEVYARDGVLFNPHYKNMGELYGSEYWTYLLPKRVGHAQATALTEQRLPISAKRAWQMGLVDKVLDKQHQLFTAQVKHLVSSRLNDAAALSTLLAEKAQTRRQDEAHKPLAAYRKFELTQMHANFYGGDAYQLARRNFVFKQAQDKTPDNIARHRQTAATKAPQPGSMMHFVWQENYALGDARVDAQHKDFFLLADQLLACHNKQDIADILFSLYQHVKTHFAEEEAVMQQIGFQHYKSHTREHNRMLEHVLTMDKNLQRDRWQPEAVMEFIEVWTRHILHADVALNQHWQDRHESHV